MVSDLICFDVLAWLAWRVEMMLNTGKKHRWGFPSASVHCHHAGIWPVMRRMNVRRRFLPGSAQFTDTDVGWEAFPLCCSPFASAQLDPHPSLIFQTNWVPAWSCCCLKRHRRLYSTENQFNKTTFQLLQNRFLPIILVQVNHIINFGGFFSAPTLILVSGHQLRDQIDYHATKFKTRLLRVKY